MELNTINIINKTGDEPEPNMMQDVLAHCQGHLVGGYKIDINVNQRTPVDAPPQDRPGWLQFEIVVYFNKLSPLRITAMQRHLGASTEFHPDREYA
jgi:hypothetical protein